MRRKEHCILDQLDHGYKENKIGESRNIGVLEEWLMVPQLETCYVEEKGGELEGGGSLACGQSEDVDIKLLRLRRSGAAPLITMWSCNPATSLVFSLATSHRHQPPDCLMFIAMG